VIKAGDAFADPREFSRERARPLAPEDRRDAILDAVVPLLREKGRDVSTRELAEAAGVAEGTLFRAFGDKEKLIAAAVERIFDPTPLWAAMRAIDLTLPLEDKLHEVLTRMHEHFRRVVSAVIALGLRERPHHGPEHRERHIADEAHLVAILEDLFKLDEHRLTVPVATVAEYVRIVAFASSMPMRETVLDDAVLSGLIARGVVKEGDL
jgi:AcrR family transcriptional regulator